MAKPARLKSVGAVLRETRRAAGLTQEQVASRLDVSRNFIYLLESGRSYPSIGTLIRVAEALGVRPGLLLDTIAQHEKKRNVDPPPSSEM